MDKFKRLTRRQRDLLTILANHIDEHGRAPTIRELGDIMHIASTNGVNEHINALIKKGYVAVEPGISRGIRVLAYADGRPFLTRRQMLDRIEELETIVADRDEEVGLYEAHIDELEVGCAGCALPAQVEALHSELGIRTLTMPNSLREAVQKGDLDTVLNRFGLPSARVDSPVRSGEGRSAS